MIAALLLLVAAAGAAASGTAGGPGRDGEDLVRVLHQGPGEGGG